MDGGKIMLQQFLTSERPAFRGKAIRLYLHGISQLFRTHVFRWSIDQVTHQALRSPQWLDLS
jgi:hypothetical protein